MKLFIVCLHTKKKKKKKKKPNLISIRFVNIIYIILDFKFL